MMKMRATQVGALLVGIAGVTLASPAVAAAGGDPPSAELRAEDRALVLADAAEREAEAAKAAREKANAADAAKDANAGSLAAGAERLETRAKSVEDLARAAKLEAYDPSAVSRLVDAAKARLEAAQIRLSQVKAARENAQKELDAASKRVTDADSGVRAAAGDAHKLARAKVNLAEAQEKKSALTAARDEAKAAETKATEALAKAKEASDRAGDALTASAEASALQKDLDGKSAEAVAAEGSETEVEIGKRQAALAETLKAIEDRKIAVFDAIRAVRKALDAERALAGEAEKKVKTAKAAVANATGASRSKAVLDNGGALSWGLTGSLLRFHSQRDDDLPGRDRNYRPRFEFIPAEVGFQFLYEPPGGPWRLKLKKEGESLQLISVGGLLLARVDGSLPERGGLSVAANLAFFENAIGLGIGFDLYRGIPVRGADGVSGSDTAFTGVLAWAFSPEGEVTPENAFAVVTVNLSALVSGITGGTKK